MGTGRVVRLEFVDLEQSLTVFVAPRAMQEQILHGMDFELGQECGPLRANAGQAGYWTS